MSAIRLSGTRGLPEELISSGDTMMLGDLVSTLALASNQTIPAALMLTGALARSGPGAGYTDTWDSAANILTALGGNNPGPALVVGNSFKLRVLNTVAFNQTLALGAGMVAGLGTITPVSASAARDFLFTFLNTQPPVSVNSATTTGSAVVTWVLPVGQTSLLQGVSPAAVNIAPGASVTGTGIPAGTTVLGVTQGQGGTLGVTLSANATVTGSALLTFGPVIKVDGIGSCPL